MDNATNTKGPHFIILGGTLNIRRCVGVCPRTDRGKGAICVSRRVIVPRDYG